jgi:hypothetical protein
MKNTKLMIATPAYDGKVNIQYALSYANTKVFLESQGVEVVPVITASGSLLVAERNRLLEAFWQSDCTHVLFIDSDLGWPPEAVGALLQADKEFIGGCYPARGAEDMFLFRPVVDKDFKMTQENHLLKMEYIPSGFILLSRGAIKKMRDKFPELYFEPKIKYINNPDPGYCLFNTEVYEGEFWGEDFVFCRRAMQAGIEIWVDPLIQFDHAGTIGMLAEKIMKEQEKIEEAKE